MSDADRPIELNVPSFQPSQRGGGEEAPKVDLEELAREIVALLKRDLREENDRTGRI